MPVYYVISEYIHVAGMIAPIKHILEAYACRLDQVDELFIKAREKLDLTSKPFATDLYYREPANPLRSEIGKAVSVPRYMYDDK